MGQPELRCHGHFIVFDDEEGICDLREECAALPYRHDFAMYRAAHARVFSADVLMDPDLGFEAG
jgi:hypothetical protein